jgi:hypothetical protein
METLGRKPTLQVASVIFLVGAVIMTAAESLLSMICEGYSVRFRYESASGCALRVADIPPRRRTGPHWLRRRSAHRCHTLVHRRGQPSGNPGTVDRVL